jgi:hypothetical protein
LLRYNGGYMSIKKLQRYGGRSDFFFKRNKQQTSPQYPQNEQEFSEWQDGLHKELQTFWKSLTDLYTDES